MIPIEFFETFKKFLVFKIFFEFPESPYARRAFYPPDTQPFFISKMTCDYSLKNI